MKKILVYRCAGMLAVLMSVMPLASQTFSSTSTGVDGALTLTTPGTVIFDPKTFSPPLDPDGDGIYNFTTITIGAGVTVKLRGDVVPIPVVWLAQGAVQINGIIDASGQDGYSASNTTQRTLTIPGSGGFAGGYPGVGSNPPSAGLGPGAGRLCNSSIGGGGSFSGNQYLVPILGGSGGSGGGNMAGGAGGGAILIASSVTIAGAGSIKAGGGLGRGGIDHSGAGAGGAIRLVAPTVSITGNLNVLGTEGATDNCMLGSTPGIVRIEGFQIGSLSVSGRLYTATPYGLYLTTAGIPSLRVVSIGGVPVATSPTGTFTVPDVTVNSNSALPVAIAAANIPLGTIITLTIFSENGPDIVVASSGLAGTLAASTASATVTLPSGFSKGFVKATFTP